MLGEVSKGRLIGAFIIKGQLRRPKYIRVENTRYSHAFFFCCSTADPYVKVSMVMNGKVAKKKKTSVVKKNNNPVFNEAFSFTIPPSCLDRVSLMVSVLANPRLGSSKKRIGRAIVGPYMYSTGAGLSHWKDMLASPKSAVAQWHALI